MTHHRLHPRRRSVFATLSFATGVLTLGVTGGQVQASDTPWSTDPLVDPWAPELSEIQALAPKMPESEEDKLRIVGGTPTRTCHFPSTVALRAGRGICTGTLIHPKVITTANHCITTARQTAYFGESERSPAFKVGANCRGLGGKNGVVANGDFGYCVLDKEVTNVPIVPVLMGCELEALKKGQPIVLTGFGDTRFKAGNAGTQRQVETPVASGIGQGGVGNREILLGHAQKGSCNGDSGGPAFIDLRTVPEFKDKKGAGWRVFGATSREGPGGSTCAATTVYGVLAKVIPTIEKQTGIDLTPCFDADGTWNPGPECKDFPDAVAGGSWNNCDAGQLSGYSHTCGENPNDKDSGGGSGDDDEDSDSDDSNSSDKSEDSTDSNTEDENTKSGEDGPDSSDEDEDSKSSESESDTESKDKSDDSKSEESGEDSKSEDSKSKDSKSKNEDDDDKDEDSDSGEDSDSSDEGQDESKPRKGGCSLSQDPAPASMLLLGGLGLSILGRRRKSN